MKIKPIEVTMVLIVTIFTISLAFVNSREPEFRMPYTWEVQTFLRDAGYDLDVDGRIGPATMECWYDWQDRKTEKMADEIDREYYDTE